MKGQTEIKTDLPFIRIDRTNKMDLKLGDIRIFMSRRYFHNGFYYVKLHVSSNGLIQRSLYFKINQVGNVIDIATIQGIY